MTNPQAASVPKVLSATPRTRHRRLREQGRRERSELFAVLRAGLIAHLGVILDGVPMVVPTGYGFDDEQVYVHRSVVEHAVNYRSAMIYAVPRLITDPDEKMAGLRALSEHLAPGQWGYARRPSRKELAATRLLAMPLDEASVKIRCGPPDDADSPDAALGLWAGELPLASFWQEPVPDPALPAGTGVPRHIQDRAGRAAYRPDRR